MKKLLPLFLALTLLLAVLPAHAEETVLEDNAFLTVTLLNAEAADDTLSLEFSVVNKTETALLCCLDCPAVNGYMADTNWFTEVGAGETRTDAFVLESLSAFGIPAPAAAVSFDLSAFDPDHWEERYCDKRVTVNPLGDDAAVFPEREVRADDVVLLDTDDLTLIFTGADPENELGWGACLYLVNKTGLRLSFFMEDCTINGIACYPCWGGVLCPHTRSCSELIAETYELASIGVMPAEVRSVSGTVCATDVDGTGGEFFFTYPF